MNSKRFLVGVDHDDDVGKTTHVLDPAKRAFKLVARTGQVQDFFFGQTFCTGRQDFFLFFQAFDRVGNGVPVGQHTAEPAMVHIVLTATLCSFCDDRRSLTLGTDEQNATTTSGDVTNRLHRTMQHRNGFLKVQDVNVVACAKDELLHLRVPTAGVVTKVDASFHQLTHGKGWQSHDKFLPFSG